jgi:hypothetical protein
MTKGQKRQKREFKLKQLRLELEPIAVQVCDEVMGPIPRDQQTLDALEVARVMIESSSGGTEVSARQQRIRDHMDREFEERDMDIVEWESECIPEEDENAHQDICDRIDGAVLLAFEVAYRETERRDNYGQDVEGNLAELTRRLIEEMT